MHKLVSKVLICRSKQDKFNKTTLLCFIKNQQIIFIFGKLSVTSNNYDIQCGFEFDEFVCCFM